MSSRKGNASTTRSIRVSAISSTFPWVPPCPRGSMPRFPRKLETPVILASLQQAGTYLQGCCDRAPVLPDQGPLRRDGLQCEQQKGRRRPAPRQEQQDAWPEQHQIVVPGNGRGQERSRNQCPQSHLGSVPYSHSGKDDGDDPKREAYIDHPRQRRDVLGVGILRKQPRRRGWQGCVIPVSADRLLPQNPDVVQRLPRPWYDDPKERGHRPGDERSQERLPPPPRKRPK